MGTRTSANTSDTSYPPAVMPRDADPYSRARSVAPGMYSYLSSRYSTPMAAEIGPPGNVRNSPASDAPATERSNSSEEERAGEMNAAAAGEMEANPKGLTGTQPGNCVTQTTCPPTSVEFRPSCRRAGDIVLRTFS